MPIWTKIRVNLRANFKSLLSPLTVFIWAICILITTIAEPFGTDRIMALSARAIYWSMVVTVSIVLGFAVQAVTQALVGPRRPVLFDVTAVSLMTLVFTPVAWLITRFSGINAGDQPQPLWVFAGYVMVCSAAVFIGRRIAPGFEKPAYGFLTTHADLPSAHISEVRQPRLLRRLSDRARGDVLRLSANDHFVEVVTVNGSETLRLRLSDAMDEMEPVVGYCVHRSHWVAHNAIVGVERESSHKLFVRLINGDRLPVGRKYRDNLKEAGHL